MFKKILIANRGEIACRVTRTAHRLGIKTVAVYSDADAKALHVQMADEAVRLGPAPSRESYLCVEKIVAAALATGAEAIHPGYGFLSENADFAAACRAAGLVFIGPSPDAITAMGSKSGAKALMAKAGVPLVPGYHGTDQNDDVLLSEARQIGFPVLLKASAGGGGKGMRAVHDEREFADALAAARREAENAFGDARMLVEKLLVEPRHVEVQVLADRHGNAVYVFDRDCSIQRRHQKVVEEAPAPGLDATLRQAMGEAAVRAALAIGYEGAGTLEFLVGRDGGFYFMEMNTRLQVEHPVTELVSGLDLVEWQLRVAAGEQLPFSQNDLRANGHAIEVRLYAEDPNNGFLPSTGRLRHFHLPTGDGVRVDTGYREGDAVSVHYDPMMAKVMAWGVNRAQAADRLAHALESLRVAGVRHNTAFLIDVLRHPAFLRGALSTHFIEQHNADLLAPLRTDDDDLLLAALAGLMAAAPLHADGNDRHSPWQTLRGFRIGAADDIHVRLKTADGVHNVWLRPSGHDWHYRLGERGGECRLEHHGPTWQLTIDDRQRPADFTLHDKGIDIFRAGAHVEIGFATAETTATQSSDDSHYPAPMNGRIIAVAIKGGDAVAEGDTLVVMEAMKMEYRLRARRAGHIASIGVKAGDLVSEGQLLVALEGQST
ncbi:MAG: acetyl/propionyl/methylcrotonyl-CoA carboxylase subunit alpha [Moraxellaceae bacterium]